MTREQASDRSFWSPKVGGGLLTRRVAADDRFPQRVRAPPEHLRLRVLPGQPTNGNGIRFSSPSRILSKGEVDLDFDFEVRGALSVDLSQTGDADAYTDTYGHGHAL